MVDLRPCHIHHHHNKHLRQCDKAAISERGDNKTLLAPDELVLVDEADVRDADHCPLLVRFEVKPTKKIGQVFLLLANILPGLLEPLKVRC